MEVIIRATSKIRATKLVALFFSINIHVKTNNRATNLITLTEPLNRPIYQYKSHYNRATNLITLTEPLTEPVYRLLYQYTGSVSGSVFYSSPYAIPQVEEHNTIFLEKNIKSTPKNPIIYHSTTPKINMLQTDLFYVANVLRLYANVFIFTANVLIIYHYFLREY